MAWIEFFRISWFKLIANGLLFLYLQFRFYPIAMTYCPDSTIGCAIQMMVTFNFMKILPIIIFTYLLTCLLEFLYGMFKQ